MKNMFENFESIEEKFKRIFGNNQPFVHWEIKPAFGNLKDATKSLKLPSTFIVGENLKKGEKCEITQGGYVVPVKKEKTNKEIIDACLRYCLHRLRCHKTRCGLSIPVKDVERVLAELK